MTRAEILRQSIERREKAIKGYRKVPGLFDEEFIEKREQELRELKRRLWEAEK